MRLKYVKLLSVVLLSYTFKRDKLFLYSHSLKQLFIFIIIISCSCLASAQSDTAKFDPKKEVTFDGKRYRVYNNWISVGGGAGYNTRWPKDERNIGADFSFHIKQQYFRIGAFGSGTSFNASNNYNFHAAIGLRKETNTYNLSAFAGPSSSFFRRPLSDSTTHNLNTVYNELGAYACIEAVYKLKYDVGIGGQVFCDYNQVQMVYGVRLILYFSGAYRGVKYGYNRTKK